MPSKRITLLLLAVGLGLMPGTALAQHKLTARWVGQDGHDVVGQSNTATRNDVQDIHIVISGLPANRKISKLKITGDGGVDWVYVASGTDRSWRAEVERKAGSLTADVYVEPAMKEVGRKFFVDITLDDGRSSQIEFMGGKADPNKRMPSASLTAQWVGQARRDRVGTGPSVGPDGLQDVIIKLDRLSPKAEVEAVAIDAPGGLTWRYGTNPEAKPSAELVRDPKDPALAELFFQPERDLADTTLTITVSYPQGRTDKVSLAAQKTDPKLAMAAPTPVRFSTNTIKATWLGQDDSGQAGDVHVALTGLSRSQVIKAIALSGSGADSWFQKGNEKVDLEPEPGAAPLVFRREANDPTKADLTFAPGCDETGGTMTLCLALNDGSITVVRFPGGKADIGLRAGPGPASSTATAQPGQDLQALVARVGSLRLSKGTYKLDRPLVIEHPIKLTADPGAILLFTPKPAGELWTAAITILSGHVTLDNFAVRFSGPVKWRENISYGPAVIGTRCNFDPPVKLTIADVNLTRLDLQAPPALGPGPWEEATRLVRFTDAACGRVEKCTLRGGPIEFFGGPWLMAGNDFQGVPSATFSPCVFAGHYVHDVVIRDNRTRLAAPAGKTWRFVVLTNLGYRCVVASNTIARIGPRDDDTIPAMNSPEIILTEAYLLNFEGKPAAISADGRVLQIPAPQGEPVRTGSVVAILAGPKAGSWCRIVQTFDAKTFLVDPPLPATGVEAVSIALGFVNSSFRDNTIEARGGSAASGLVIVGNQYGTQIVGNHIIGAGEAFRITSCPSEKPVHWGWSHNPEMGLVIENNTIEDSPRGGLLEVEHGPPVKTNRGRVYLSATFRNNTVTWTEAFLKANQAKLKAGERPGFTIGSSIALDPGELVLTESTNMAVGPINDRPGVTMRIHAGTINGQAVKGKDVTLPGASTARR